MLDIMTNTNKVLSILMDNNMYSLGSRYLKKLYWGANNKIVAHTIY